MIASGEKTIETRLWSTDYRGELVIVSSKIPKVEPAGCALAIVTLVDCRAMTHFDEMGACCCVYPGAFAWVLRNVRRITPFPISGQLKLFDLELPQKVVLGSNQ